MHNNDQVILMFVDRKLYGCSFSFSMAGKVWAGRSIWVLVGSSLSIRQLSYYYSDHERYTLQEANLLKFHKWFMFSRHTKLKFNIPPSSNQFKVLPIISFSLSRVDVLRFFNFAGIVSFATTQRIFINNNKKLNLEQYIGTLLRILLVCFFFSQSCWPSALHFLLRHSSARRCRWSDFINNVIHWLRRSHTHTRHRSHFSRKFVLICEKKHIFVSKLLNLNKIWILHNCLPCPIDIISHFSMKLIDGLLFLIVGIGQNAATVRLSATKFVFVHVYYF